jgi:heme exporter protein B
LGFFVGAAALAPLALGNDPDLLQRVGAPLVWIITALACLMVLERLFQGDLEDASLDQLLLSPAPLEAIVAVKGAALWTAVGLPLALAGLPAAIALQTPPAAAVIVSVGLALGAAAFIGVGLLGAALAAGVRRGGVLIAVLVLPFFAPPIIFGAAAAQMAASDPFGQPFLFLAVLALGGAALGPLAAAAALRLQAE